LIEIVTSPSLPSQNGERNELSVILFNAKLLALSPIKTSSAPIGVAFNVCQCISVVGAFAIGLCISKSVPLYSTSTI